MTALKSGHCATDWSVITLEEWALISGLAAEGATQAKIAARLRMSGMTAIKAIASECPPKYGRRPAPNSFTPYPAQVRQLLADAPDMPATVLGERVRGTGSIRWFRDNDVRVLPVHAGADDPHA